MRRASVVLIAAATAAVVAGAARGGIVHLNWKEHADVRGKPAIAFRIETIATRRSGGKKAWAVIASITNRTSKPLKISDQFGLALFKDPRTTDPRRATLMPAAAFSPPVPKVLGPGKTWRGSFGGAGVPPVGSYVRVVFGWFSGPALQGTKGFDWLTDHAKLWGANLPTA